MRPTEALTARQIMATDWMYRWWAKFLDILRHPWRSLISLLAAVGGLVWWFLRFLGRCLLWMFRKLRHLLRMRTWKLVRVLAYAFVTMCVLGLLFTIAAFKYPSSKVPAYEPVDQHVYISQGWGWTGGQNEPLRQLFYFTPQGAGLKDIRYSWFVNLEVPWGTTRFADPERMSAYGFLVDTAPEALNSGHLPVGFASRYDPRFGENVLDLSCAACHTGQLNVTKNGKRYGLRVDGAGAMHAFTAMHIGDFAPELLSSLTATYLNPFKFTRFARAVLGPLYPSGRWKLHGDLKTVIGGLASQAWNENLTRNLYPTEEGPGRIDALGRIANTVFGQELSPKNYGLSNAPVRYPPLWDIWKFNYVQYNASVRQPMTRNVSESMGVGATTELLNLYGAPIPGDDRFDTSVQMDNLSELEMALWSLEPPKWNEDCMGKVDWDRAKKGRTIFENTCQHCHGPFPADDVIKEWFAYLKTPDKSYRGRVLADWQSFLDGLYEAPAPAPDQEDRELKPDIQQSHTLPYKPIRPAGAEEVKEGETQQPRILPSSSFQPLQPLRTAAGGEEGREAGLRPPDVSRPPATGMAPLVSSDFPLWMMHPLSVEDIGTDPTAAVNFLDKTIDLSMLGLSPQIANDGMRTLFEQDLHEKIAAYAKDILRLTGKETQTDEKIQVNQLSLDEKAALRDRALDVIGKGAILKDKNPSDQLTLETDIQELQNAVTTGQPQIENFLASMDLHKLNTGVALRLIVFRARQRFYALRNYDQPTRNMFNGFGELDVPMPLPQYKPRPLAGIWAAGPFLHNGSVPTIYQLLLPADRRDKKFFVGTREFDSANLGFSTQPSGKNGFWLDTSITGNSNVGHEFRKGYIPWKQGNPPQYGVIDREFTEEERRDIIEYLKVHRDEHGSKSDFAKDPDGYLREGLDTTNVCQ
jgi:hypothetical protein